MKTDSPPPYDPLQRAFHAAFEPELTAVVDALEVAPGARVLDVPCGDGFYTRRLARRPGASGVVGIDRDTAYLSRAERGTQEPAVTFQKGDAYALPCDDGSFDHALCAMSFISLEEPVRALREVRRVLTPGGGVGVLETDEYHHVLLTWPVEVEVAVHRAVRDARGGQLAPSRRVNRMLHEAGFDSPRKTTFTADRQAPFPPAVVEFLTLHLAFLRKLVRPHFSPKEMVRFDCYADPDHPESLARRADAELTCLVTLHQARRPG